MRAQGRFDVAYGLRRALQQSNRVQRRQLAFSENGRFSGGLVDQLLLLSKVGWPSCGQTLVKPLGVDGLNLANITLGTHAALGCLLGSLGIIQANVVGLALGIAWKPGFRSFQRQGAVRDEGRIAAECTTQWCGAINDEVEAPALIGRDAWRSGVDEPSLGHHVSLRRHGFTGNLAPGPLHKFGPPGQEASSRDARAWFCKASVRRPHPGSAVLPQRPGASGSWSRSVRRNAICIASAVSEVWGSLGMAWSHAASCSGMWTGLGTQECTVGWWQGRQQHVVAEEKEFRGVATHASIHRARTFTTFHHRTHAHSRKNTVTASSNTLKSHPRSRTYIAFCLCCREGTVFFSSPTLFCDQYERGPSAAASYGPMGREMSWPIVSWL